MSTSRLAINSSWNLGEVIGSSLVLFILYKLILLRLGVSALGVWSLVLATTSMARMADLGAAGGLARYIAVSRARGDPGDTAISYVETALITNTLLYLSLGAFLYWPAWQGLGALIHGPEITEARMLLPFAVCSFVMFSISGVVTAALIGLNNSYQKSIIMLASAFLQAGVAICLINTMGLRAVAFAQICQCFFIIVSAWLLIVRTINGRWELRLPYRIKIVALKELLGFGLRLQLLNIMAFPFDFIIKLLLSNIAGVQALGIYELANRGVQQIRMVIMAPSQNLTPLFATQHYLSPTGLRETFVMASSNIITAGFISMLALTAVSPLMSYIWFGKLNVTFVCYSTVLAAGWLINIAAAPGYFLGIGTGRLRWNILGAAVTTIASGVLASLFGQLTGSLGVVVGAMLGASIGWFLTWALNCRDLQLPLIPDFKTLSYVWKTAAQILISVLVKVVTPVRNEK